MILVALAALSLAGAILQFVDFSSKIYSSSREIYESSSVALTVNEEIGKAVKNWRMTQKLRWPLDHNDPRLSPATRQNPDDAELNDLCGTFQKIASELKIRLNSLKVQGNHQRWDIFRQAIKGAWAEKDFNLLTR